jgi:hypothetical protein
LLFSLRDQQKSCRFDIVMENNGNCYCTAKGI